MPISALASSPTSSRDAAAQAGKQPARKAPEQRERKRPPSSIGRGCVGCIMPLDSIASTMAVRKFS